MPVTIALIFLLLFSSFSSLRQAGLIIPNLPFALIGGIVALFLSGQYLSVPAPVGFIALFRVAVLNGIMLELPATPRLQAKSTGHKTRRSMTSPRTSVRRNAARSAPRETWCRPPFALLAATTMTV